MEQVAVMNLLLFAPAIETLVSPRFTMVIDETCTYLDGVWSKLMIKEGGIWYFSTWLTTRCKNFSSAFFWAPTGICTFPVVLIRQTKPIRRKRLWAQNLSIFKFSFSRRGYRFSKAFAVAISTKELTTPHVYLAALRQFWTSGSILLRERQGRPLNLFTMNFLGDSFLRCTSLIWAS